MRLCFFTKLPDKSLFDTVEFYRNDIGILKCLGFEVLLASSVAEIAPDCDVYVSWFPYWGALVEPLAMLRRKPHITIGNVDAAIPSAARRTRWKDSLLARMESWCVKHADVCLATSQFEAPAFRRLGARDVRVVYHGIDADRYRPNADSSNSECRVLTITHVNEGNYIRKCLGPLIAAIPIVKAKFPDVKFVIGGRKDAATAARIEQQARAMNVADSLELPGMLTTEAKIALMQSSRVYLQPTLHEGFGVAIAEAMSCGLPVVSSQAGAVREVLGDAGLYAAGDDPAAIAEQVCALLLDSAQRQRLSQAGRHRVVEYFSVTARRQAFEMVFDETLKRYGMSR
jgi:glycosyltransferase involved in cell wall biosynthesis